MREIKFREAIFAEPDNRFMGFHYWGWIDGEWVDPESTDSEASKQYTDLKDKNGKEGYHKDIAKDECGVQYSIEWIATDAKFILIQVSGGILRGNTVDMRYLSTMGIVGNIYENPELLER